MCDWMYWLLWIVWGLSDIFILICWFMPTFEEHFSPHPPERSLLSSLIQSLSAMTYSDFISLGVALALGPISVIGFGLLVLLTG